MMVSETLHFCWAIETIPREKSCLFTFTKIPKQTKDIFTQSCLMVLKPTVVGVKVEDIDSSFVNQLPNGGNRKST